MANELKKNWYVSLLLNTNYHEFNGLKQHPCIGSQFSCSEGGRESWGFPQRLSSHLEILGKNLLTN